MTQLNKGTTITYLGYDANGIRKSKSKVTKKTTVNSTYIYDSQGRLRTETAGTFTRNYLYSADGIIGYEEDGERYLLYHCESFEVQSGKVILSGTYDEIFDYDMKNGQTLRNNFDKFSIYLIF